MSSLVKRCALWAVVVTAGISPAFAAPPLAESCPSVTPIPRAAAPSRPGGTAQAPIDVIADRVELEGGMSVFSGNVEVHHEDETIYADRVVYDRQKDEIQASGNVRVRNVAGDAIDTRYLEVQRRENTGLAQAVVFQFRGNRARGDAREVRFRSRELVELDKTRYTHCPPGQDSWFIVARDIELDYSQDVGTARNAYISFMSVPIFYWPYLSFPLSDQRKSGFLAPYFGSDRTSGMFLAAPYYFNIAPNYDATLTPRFLENRGLQWLSEGRYLGKDYDGVATFDYLDNDRLLDKDRWGATFKHNHYLSPLWTAEANFNRVSDTQYLNDFAIGIAAPTATHMPQKLETRYGNELWRGFARLFAYQTVDPTIPASLAPYSRLPELQLVADAPGPVNRPRYGLFSEYTNFEHETKPAGQRLIVEPAASLPLRNSYGFLIPRAAVRYNHYSLSNVTGDDSPSLSVPIFSVDSGVVFERGLTLGGSRHTQTFEPRLFYVYIPNEYQDDLPNFDTGPQDFTYANLFRENRFFGGDRVGDANRLTFGLTTRLLDPIGAERARLSLGQIYYFDEQRVLLPDERATSVYNDASYVVEQARVRLAQPWYVRNDLQWDPYEQDIRKSSTYLQYSPRPQDILNLGHLYSNLPGTAAGAQEEQVEASTQWRFSTRWSALAQYVYSLSSHSNRESYLGFEYNACCWIGRVYVQRVIDPIRGQINKYFFEFELSGLMRLGVPKISPLSRGAFIFQD